MRINKYLSLCNIGSRRKIEEMLWQGQFTINGKTAIPGQVIDPSADTILFNGAPINPTSENIYIALNKPRGYISTTSDEKDRKTVLDLIDSDLKNERLYPIGRLDKESTGLILLTNDGDLALKLTHPKYHYQKKYEVEVSATISDIQLRKLAGSFLIEGKQTIPAQIERISSSKFQIILKQGIKRQIREMCKNVGLNVKKLNRVSIGPINLENLPVGKYRNLTSKEVDALKT